MICQAHLGSAVRAHISAICSVVKLGPLKLGYDLILPRSLAADEQGSHQTAVVSFLLPQHKHLWSRQRSSGVSARASLAAFFRFDALPMGAW